MSIQNECNVLIIGKNSYIGKSFIQYCKDRQGEVAKNQIHIDALSGKDGEWKQHSFKGYDTVILLSGIVHTPSASSEMYYKVNYEMAVDIAKKAKDANVKQFILMSTIGVYGNKINVRGNEVLRDPKTEYAKSKQMAEDEIKKLQEETFQTAFVQPPMVYGKNCTGNFTRLVHLIQKVHAFPKLSNARSSIYILNLCEFLRCLVMQQCSGTFIPQNAEYLNSSDIAIAVKKSGVKVFMIPGMSLFIRLVGDVSSQVGKIFGNYQFPLAMSKYQHMEYQIYSTVDSLEYSVKK